LLVREEVLLAGLCERKILFRLKIYDRIRQAQAKQTGCLIGSNKIMEHYTLNQLYVILRKVAKIEILGLVKYAMKRLDHWMQ